MHPAEASTGTVDGPVARGAIGAPSAKRDREKDRESLGRRIRGLRQGQQLTLSDVASSAGVSVSLLSQVERGKTDPSLDTLRDIADALGTTPFHLLAGGASRSRLVRVDQRPLLALPGADIQFELLSHSLEGTFEVMLWTLAPGGANPPVARGHVGEEALLILSGNARFELGDEVFELAEGDFITYEGRVPHRMKSLGDRPVSGLSIMSPPAF
jgi:transcriptional regulator with XRE-family HTH domain